MSAKKMQKKGDAPLAAVSGVEAVHYLRDQLRLHRALGIDAYPIGDDIKRFMDQTARKPSRPGDSPVRQAGGGGAEGVDLNQLRQEMTTCTLCHLAENRIGTIQGCGNTSCRLMVVGDWSNQSEDDYNPDVLFSPAEDEMLWKMMTAINLSREDVFVTNCVKCCPKPGQRPDDRCEKSCFSYLEREIATGRPRVICTMGEVAARVVTGSRSPFTRLRGKFMEYRYQQTGTTAVMVTFHPRFLLQFEEMKKAPWLDLQAVQQRLAEP